MGKQILIVYYSRTWSTKKIALEISDLIDCDIEEIVDEKNRSWIIWYFWAWRDAALKKLTKIQDTKFDPKEYKTLIIWTPVRDFTMATSIRTYLTQSKNSLPENMFFFCTQGSAGDMATFQDMTILSWKKPIFTTSFNSREIKSESYKVKLNNFIQRISHCEGPCNESIQE